MVFRRGKNVIGMHIPSPVSLIYCFYKSIAYLLNTMTFLLIDKFVL